MTPPADQHYRYRHGSVSLCAIGWMGHAACSLWGLEWNAVLGMWIGGYQRAA
jgi:hypothetical protein